MKILRLNLITYLQNKPKSFSMSLGVALFILLGYIDYITFTDISFSAFYLIPVYLITWFVGARAGFLISLASAISSDLFNPLEKYFIEHSLIFYWNTSMKLTFYAIITYLLSEFKNSLNREKQLARTDSITGISNSRAFFEFAGLEINRATRYKYPLTIAYLDIDNFKKINDKFGYSWGDSILKQVAETIKNTIRVTDIIARLGGDKFVVLLPETAYEPAQKVIRRVHFELLEAMNKPELQVTFSIGAVTFIKLPKSVEEMIERADNIMYFVKLNGKNMVKHERFDESSTSG